MTVRDLLSRIDSKELTEWRAYFRVENERQEAAMKKQAPLEQNISASMRGYGK